MDSLLSSMGLLIKLLFFAAIAIISLGIYSYNRLQTQGQAVKSAHANVLTIIQKRVDMINKLMDIAKDYSTHEKLIHISVSQNVMDTFKTSNTALANVNAMAMNYPELKANVTYQNLMEQINIVENDLQKKRELYNNITQDYNSYRLQIPTVFFSSVLGFAEAQYFDFDNLQELREFNTDDGQLLRGVLAQASEKMVDMTQKGANKVQEKIHKASERSENIIKTMAEKANAASAGGLKCPQCSFHNEGGDAFCIKCGTEL